MKDKLIIEKQRELKDAPIAKRNNSNLSYIDCCMRLTSDQPFEEMEADDLDSIYYVAMGSWAYHLTRQGYIDTLNKKRIELRNHENKS